MSKTSEMRIRLSPEVSGEFIHLMRMEGEAHQNLGKAHQLHTQTIDHVAGRRSELQQELMETHKKSLPEGAQVSLDLDPETGSGDLVIVTPKSLIQTAH